MMEVIGTIPAWVSALAAVVIASCVFWGLVWSPIRDMRKELREIKSQLDTLKGSTETYERLFDMYAKRGPK